MMEPDKILLADDEETFAMATSDLFRLKNIDCTYALNATCAIQMLRANSYDLLISDIKMPGTRNLDYLKEVEPLAQGMPIIVVTAYPSIHTAVQSVSLPVIGYLVKPIEFDELYQLAINAIQKHKLYQLVCKTRNRLSNWQNKVEAAEIYLRQSKASAPSLEALILDSLHAITEEIQGVKQLFALAGGSESAGMTSSEPQSQELVLRETLLDTIHTLEKTRHAFKSKDLGELRKRLEKTLERLKKVE